MAMAMATSSPPCEPDAFDLGIYTPKNLARAARAALLRDSSPVEITDIDVSPQLDEFLTLPSSGLRERQSPIDITEAAGQLGNEQTAAHNAKIRVFRTFCTHFNRVAEEFPSGLERDFAQHFSVSFLEFWKQALGSTPSASTPTYSSVAATATAAAIATVSPIRPSTTSSVYPQQLPTATYRQGQRAPAPPREDL
ncbi:Ankyrin repeat-containing domain protein [Metarhizium robertsii ARSEF 23]|uniref:Ankyrin repeat-containing domain protein n=1 Tax=Metarhizium robertsii (strain ARSEF 23 / ATCC MYA-3075) TaxID=655844 RepID=A0A0B2X7F0_METRA|nr:Ankyrin repeat-containing domain protein [Metarhizium robertsii ARSEF 23]KHO10848.1 Ankyrin repeat-containing domain protein [Metarhizium robertsii ARSEF 23]